MQSNLHVLDQQMQHTISNPQQNIKQIQEMLQIDPDINSIPIMPTKNESLTLLINCADCGGISNLNDL